MKPHRPTTDSDRRSLKIALTDAGFALADELLTSHVATEESLLAPLSKEEREQAVRAAKVFGLKLAGVDLLRSDAGPKVLEVNSSPGLEGIEKASGKNIAGMLYDHIEAHVRPQPVRRRKTK